MFSHPRIRWTVGVVDLYSWTLRASYWDPLGSAAAPPMGPWFPWGSPEGTLPWAPAMGPKTWI